MQLVGDDGANTPPAHALARRGIVAERARLLASTATTREPNPPARIVDAVAAGEIDVAIVWGPLAGYFADAPAGAAAGRAGAAAGRRAAAADGLRHLDGRAPGGRRRCAHEIDAVLERRRAEIDAILADYGVPRVDAPTRQRGVTSDEGAALLAAVAVLALAALRARGARVPRRSGRDRERRSRSRSCRSSPGRPGRRAPIAARASDYEENAYHLAQGKRLYAWFNCIGCHANGGGGIGPAADGRQWIYGGAIENIVAHDPRGPAERHAVVPAARSRTTRSGRSPPMSAR